jgi:hypothetical protein
MPSSFTSRIGLEQQATGEGNNVWGANLNSNVIGLIEDAIAGLTSVALTASDVTLTKANGTPDQSRAAILYLHGTLGANVAVVVPSVTKAYVVDNRTTGAFSATVRTAGGSGVAVPQGTAQTLYVTGTSVIATSPATSATSPAFGTAAFANVGTSVNELAPVSAADARYARLASANVFTSVNEFRKQVFSAPVTVAYAATVSLDFTLGSNFVVSLTGNSTFVPVGYQPGQGGNIWLYQDSVGGRTVAWTSPFKFAASTAPTLTVAASAVDVVPYAVRTSSAIDCGFLGDSR